MIKITKYLFCVFLVSILMILSVKSIKASILFSDNFLDTSSFNNWNAIFSGGIDNASWKIENGQLVGEITAYDNSDNWYYHEDTVETGQNIKFNLNLNINAPDCASQNPSFLYQQIEDDIGLLATNYGSNKYLTDALVAVDLKDNNKILDNIFGFRKLKKRIGDIGNNIEQRGNVVGR